MNRFLSATFCAVLVACGQPTPAPPQPDSGPGGNLGQEPTLAVTSVAPSHGSIDGGTAVVISGSGFAPGAAVAFGSVGALSVNVVSDAVIDAVTPPALDAGPVAVSVTLPVGTATLPGGFTYDRSPLLINFCVLHFPTTLSSAPGVSPGTVYGWVYVPGVTDRVGQGPGIVSQVGYGAAGSTPDSTWSWAQASYDGDEDGLTPGDHANDEYAGALPVVPNAGSHDFAVRFSRDNGTTWTPCDAAGNTPTSPYSPANAGKLTVAAPVVPTIGYCALHSPTALGVQVGQVAGPVYGWVYAAGLTDQGSAAGPGIAGQLGEGPHGSAPDSTWRWIDAAWDGKQGPQGHNDEYNATLPAQPDAGAFDYAYRFAITDGGFVLCDSAGDQPYQPAKAGQLTVSVPPPLAIGYCATHFPTSLTTDVGFSAGPIYGWVYVAGITDQGPDAGAGLTAELGLGPAGSLPDAGWAWVAASFDAKQGPGEHNDEYMAMLPAQGSAGSFAYAFRFEVDGGTGFVARDTAGDATYSPASAGVLTVVANAADGGSVDGGGLDGGDAGAPAPEVAFCRFAAPTALLGEAFTQSTPVHGDVYQPDVTQGPGQGPGIIAQAGFGPLGSVPPTTDGGGWIWAPAAYSGDVDGLIDGGLANDRYAAVLNFPDAGSYAMAFRMSYLGGPARLCDAAGDALYTPANQAVLTVVPAPLTVDWCDLQFPPSLTAAPSQDAGPVFGQVYKAGLTTDAGQAGDIIAALGVGPPGANPLLPDSGFTWVQASYDGNRGNNDEYSAPLIPPSDAGTYSYFFRFSEDNGNVWTVCGYQNPFAAGGDAGVLTVQ